MKNLLVLVVLVGVAGAATRYALGRDMAWTFVVQHETHGVGARARSGVHIGLACEAANLDAGAVRNHGNQSNAGVRCGKPKDSS